MSAAAPVVLLDVNLLVALSWPSHVHHHLAARWFESGAAARWATTPVTEAALLRLSMHPAVAQRRVPWSEARSVLRRALEVAGHERWPLDADLVDDEVLDAAPLTGHRQVTDAVLVAAARRRGALLATLDRTLPEALAPQHREAVVVVA